MDGRGLDRQSLAGLGGHGWDWFGWEQSGNDRQVRLGEARRGANRIGTVQREWLVLAQKGLILLGRNGLERKGMDWFSRSDLAGCGAEM